MSTTRITRAAVLSLAFLLVAGPASGGPVREGDALVVPPADSPDLSLMALTRGDTYGTVSKEGHVRSGKGIVATYIRTFAGASGGGGNPLLYLESRVNLLRSASEAQRLLDTRVRRFSTTDARTKLRRHTGLRARSVRGERRALIYNEGDRAFFVKLSTREGKIHFLVVGVRVGRVLHTVYAVGQPGVTLFEGDAIRLARHAARRMTRGLSPVNVTLPTFSGEAVVGGTLTATPGTWNNAPNRSEFQWMRCGNYGPRAAPCRVIPEAAYGPTYVPVPADQGWSVTVSEVATNRVGSTTALADPPRLVLVGPGAAVNTAPPTISGTLTVGETLTAEPGVWDASASFEYAWHRCDPLTTNCFPVSFPNATGPTYVLQTPDQEHSIVVSVKATNASGWRLAESFRTELVSAGAGAPTNISLPTISGSAVGGQTVTAGAGTWAGSPTTFVFTWLICDPTGADCISSYAQPFLPVSLFDAGSTLRVSARAANASGSTVAVSAPTAPITGAHAEAPAIGTRPTISGTPSVGETLTASAGAWTGNAPMTFQYYWLRCRPTGPVCTGVGGFPFDFDDPTYTIVPRDAGFRIRANVRATNPFGDTFTFSPATAVVSP